MDMTTISDALRLADQALNAAAAELTIAGALAGREDDAATRAHALAVAVEDDLSALRALTASLNTRTSMPPEAQVVGVMGLQTGTTYGGSKPNASSAATPKPTASATQPAR
jgi:hypothetical protein